jgi:hypothetical protein
MATLLTRAQELLRLKLPQLSPAMQEDFAKGNLNFADSVYYKRYEITGAGGLLDLLYNDDAIKDGYTNISKQKIKQGCAIMIDRITVRIGYTAATNTTYTAANINFLPVANIGTVDPIISNCELEIDVAQLNIFQAPINSFNQESVGINGDKDGIILTAPKLITDAQEMQFRLHVPQGATISGTTNRYFIEVALRGAEIRVK